jgi:hypothetical protein
MKTASLLLCAGIALSACTTMGTGTGSVSPGNAPVSFAWKSADGGGNNGTMSATLAGGKTFSGPYLQITTGARSQDFDPMWTGWESGWGDWGWAPFPESGFTTLYSDRVMANLQAADGQRMRCQFYLNDPIDGMAGGGQGECQLKGDRSVDVTLKAAGTTTN